MYSFTAGAGAKETLPVLHPLVPSDVHFVVYFRLLLHRVADSDG